MTTRHVTTWQIQDRTVPLPVTIPDAECTAAVFTADPADAATVLGGTPFTPWTMAGRAVSVLMVIRYGEWVLGTYDEVGVGLLVAGPGLRMGLHMVDLPVTGDFTRQAGIDIWGLPKWLMTAELEFGRQTTTVTVADGGQSVLDARLTPGSLRVPFGLPGRIPAWSLLDHGAQEGVLLRGSMPARVRDLRIGRGSADIELGDHPMADRMAALGMGAQPKLCVHTSGLRGQLGSFTPVR